MAADGLDLLGDLACRAPFGALEDHVFEQMRDAVDLDRFVPGPGLDPGSQ